MGKIREWVGGISFRIYLWSIRMTAEQYFELLGRDYVVRQKIRAEVEAVLKVAA